MKKIVLFLVLCALVVLFSACVIAPKDTKNTAAPKVAPTDVAVVEESVEATESVVEEEATEEIVTKETAELPEICLDFPENVQLLNEPFKKLGDYEWGGKATESGVVKSRQENVWGSTVEVVYLVMEEPAYEGASFNFYEYAKEKFTDWTGEEVGTDAGFGGGVPFRIGILKDGEFSTTALIFDDVKKTILNALGNGSKIPLTFAVPKYIGRGAPDNFSFACVIN